MKEVSIGEVVWYQNPRTFHQPRAAKVVQQCIINGVSYEPYYVVELLPVGSEEEKSVGCLGINLFLTLLDAYASIERSLNAYLDQVRMQIKYAKEEEREKALEAL